jgi:peptidyl-prolyl cis-trans isomerase B (cyclophilin B)
MKMTFQRLALAAVAVFALANVAQATPAASLADVNKAAGTKIEMGKHVRVQTTKGTFEVVLFPKVAPKTVENFLKLVKAGVYNGTTFHRVIPGFMAQGGDPLSKKLPAGDPSIGTGGSGKNIPDEFSTKVKHLTGSLAMAHSGMPNSASTQFYVCYVPQPRLDGQYCVFGQVTKGMDVVEKLNASAEGVKPDKMIKLTVF